MRTTEAQRLRDQGLTHREIADLLGVTDATVRRWLRPEVARERERQRDRSNRLIDGHHPLPAKPCRCESPAPLDEGRCLLCGHERRVAA